MEKKKLTRKEAVQYLAQQGEGGNTELIEKIGEDLFEQFSCLGFIKAGKKTWKITQTGIRQNYFYREPTDEEKKFGRLLHRLGV